MRIVLENVTHVYKPDTFTTKALDQISLTVRGIHWFNRA